MNEENNKNIICMLVFYCINFYTTMFLPEQLVTINEEQIIQTAGMIVSTDAIKKVDAMLVRQLQIGEYDG